MQETNEIQITISQSMHAQTHTLQYNTRKLINNN